MRKSMIVVVLIGLIVGLTGCEKSAQEKVAEEQLKAMEAQKAVVEGFKKSAEEVSVPTHEAKK